MTQTMKTDALAGLLGIPNAKDQTLGPLVLLLQKTQNLAWLCLSIKEAAQALTVGCLSPKSHVFGARSWMEPTLHWAGLSLAFLPL